MQKQQPSTSVISVSQAPEKKEMARALRQAMTTAETHLWQSLRGRRLNGLEFRRQQIIGGFIADFYCHEAALVIEADGSVHNQQKDYDAERDRIIAARQLKIMRFTNTPIETDLPNVLHEIAATAATRIPPLLLSPFSGEEGPGVRAEGPGGQSPCD